MKQTPGDTELARVRTRVGAIPDPEIPVITLEDLGILREVDRVEGRVRVVLTPTYSGCPATEAIRDRVRAELAEAGHVDAIVELTLSPAWSTDWITEAGREKLRDYGIAPPACASHVPVEAATAAPGAVISIRRRARRASEDEPTPTCPRCGAARVETISHHGSTPCKALYRCLACAEPFDYFKPY